MASICWGCRFLNDDLKTCSKGLAIINGRWKCKSFEAFTDNGLVGFESPSRKDVKRYQRNLRKRRKLMEGE